MGCEHKTPEEHEKVHVGCEPKNLEEPEKHEEQKLKRELTYLFKVCSLLVFLLVEICQNEPKSIIHQRNQERKVSTSKTTRTQRT